jgi:hypothetical protein
MSCASNYKPIYPQKLQYHNQSISDNIEFSYHYDVLTESKNSRYVKHEIKNHLQLVAVKITNLTGHDINPINDAVFYINKKAVYPVDENLTGKKIKQGVPIYLLYLLMSPITPNTGTNTTYGKTNTNSFPIGLIFGPVISGFNMAIAGSANKHFRDELEKYSLDRQIQHGETIYALVAFQDIGMDEITLRLK